MNQQMLIMASHALLEYCTVERCQHMWMLHICFTQLKRQQNDFKQITARITVWAFISAFPLTRVEFYFAHSDWHLWFILPNILYEFTIWLTEHCTIAIDRNYCIAKTPIFCYHRNERINIYIHYTYINLVWWMRWRANRHTLRANMCAA